MKLIKRTFFCFVLLAAFTFSQPIVLAQTATPTPTLNPKLKPFVQQRKMEIKERISELRASKSAALADLRKEKVRMFWERLYNRLLALIEREQKLISRLETRIVKIETNNEDIEVADIKTELNKDKTALDKAKADLLAANDSVEDVLSSSNPKEAFKSIRDTVYDIRRAIKDVHVSLAQIIGKVRGLRVAGSDKLSPTASPTVTSTPTLTLTPTP